MNPAVGIHFRPFTATSPAAACLIATGLLWTAAIVWPPLVLWVGIADYGTPFLDSYAVLASLDALRAGIDPHGPNALDPLGRGHVYSDWWLAFHWLGLGRAHNGLVGVAGVMTFGFAVWATARPRHWGESAWLFAILVSPPFLLALTRANNDLAIFVVLAVCSMFAASPGIWKTLLAWGCLGLATGLKYFPAPAALAFLWCRPVRTMPAMLLGAMVAAGAALASVWGEVDRARFTIGSGVHTFGASLWWRDFGWADSATAVPSVVVLVGGAVILVATGLTRGLSQAGGSGERFRAALGAIVLLTCFLAGMNYAYRWVFALWPAVWMWRRSSDAALTRRGRGAARVACALLGISVWADGLLCLVVNLWAPQFSTADYLALDVHWRRATQPAVWVLMMALSGWLLDGALQSLREWWATRNDT